MMSDEEMETQNNKLVYAGRDVFLGSEHSRGDTTKEPIAISSVVVGDIRNFLLLDYNYSTKYVFLGAVTGISSSVAIALEAIPLMVKNSYLGTKIDEKAQEDGWKPSADFKKRFDQVLAELSFTDNIYNILRGILQYGDKVYRIVRVDPKAPNGQPLNTIISLESIPADILTIVPDIFVNKKGAQTFTLEKNYVIRDADWYVLNERSSTSNVNNESIVTLPIGTEAEVIINKDDVIHFAYNRVDHKCLDMCGRITWNIWGEPPLESIRSEIKEKIMLTIDYDRWVHNAVPRQHHAIDNSALLNPDLYTALDKGKAAQTAIDARIKSYLDNRFRQDLDPDSPTYMKWIEVGVDEIMVTSGDVTVTSMGGQPAPFTREEIQKNFDRVVCTRFALPMSMLSWESGSTYAIGRVTAQFMHGFGGALLRDLERDMKIFMKREFTLRGWMKDTVPLDWENIYFDYEIVDLEEKQAVLESAKADAITLNMRSTALINLLKAAIISESQAFAIMKSGTKAFVEMEYSKNTPPPSLAAPQPTGAPSGAGTGTSMPSSSERSEPKP
jgi:hypothetical protein